MNTSAVQAEIKRIANEVRTRGYKLNWKRITQKSLRDLAALGLTIERGDLAQEIVHEVIRQAQDAGGQVITETTWHDGDASVTTITTQPTPLYRLLHNNPKNKFDIVAYLRGVKWS